MTHLHNTLDYMEFQFIKRLPALACSLLISSTLYAHTKPIDNDTIQNTQVLKELIVTGTVGGGYNKIGHLSLSGSEINKHPSLLGEHDVIKALQSTSGVVSGTEGFAGLYVRGGENDQNLYQLDGLPLLNVYHFGGLFSTLNTHSVERVDFYKGTFPSFFSERASSIVDVSLKRPTYDQIKGIVSVGLISGQIFFSAPLKKGSSALSVALRRTWFDVFSAPAIAILNATKKDDGKKTIFHYNFTDFTMKLSATDHRKNDISFLFFYGKDNFKLGEERFDPKEPSSIQDKDINKMSWGNYGMAVDYKFSTSVGKLIIQPYISNAFSSDLQENYNGQGNSGSMTATTELKPSVLQAGMRETFYFSIINILHGEAGFQQTWYDYNIGNPIEHYVGITDKTATVTLPGNSRNGLLSVFTEFHCDVANLIHGSFGLRENRYLSGEMKHWNLEPRFALKIDLPSNSSISAGFSRVNQYAQQVSSNYMYLPSDAWLPTASKLKPLQCDIYSAGFFKSYRNKFNIKAEIWLKRMHNIAEFKTNISPATTSIPWYEKLTFGKGWAYGLDLELDGKYKSITWNIAYGLMWNWRKFPEINAGKRFPAKFDNRNKIDINLSWKINERLELTGQWEYMTGNRTTLALYNIATPDLFFPDAPFANPLDPAGNKQDGIDYYNERNNVRIPAFHRLNLNLSMTGRINDALSYQWDFGLYNAYCRMNPFSVIKSYVNSEWDKNGNYRRFKALSLFPILPAVSYTLYF